MAGVRLSVVALDGWRTLFTIKSYILADTQMVLAVDVLGFALIAVVFPAGLMTYVAWQNWDKPGSRWFAYFVLGITGWSTAYGVSLIVDDPQLTLYAIIVRLFFANVVPISWFLLAYEYGKRERLPLRSPWMLLFVFPFVNVAVALTAPDIVFTEWRMDVLGVFRAEFGPWFYLHTAYSYVLTVTGIALFVDDYRKSQGIRRNQTGVLLAGALIAFVANLVFVAGYTPYPDLDLTPLAFLVTTTIFAWGLFRYRLLELLPIARKTVLDQMHDAVITLDEDSRVVDLNAAAAALFGVSEEAAVGAPGERLFEEYPQMIDRFGAAVHVDTEITVTQDGEQRYFHLEITPVGSGASVVDGRVIVLRDVTELKEREQELDLLKQVLSRVLRHNIRNDVSVVSGYAEEIIRRTDGEPASLAEKIQAKSHDIATQSHKAATVERVLTRSQEPVALDLRATVEEAVADVTDSHGEADVQVDLPSGCAVSALSTLPIAIRNVVENAIIHSDSERPRVSVTATCDEDSAVLEVRDDGPGIPESELAVFELGEETQLHHSSGIGLWLVVLIVRRSNGSVSFENDEDGAVVRMTFDRP
jgi:PAS domain S-box-containing protein